jgi:hypothetical protein
MQQKNRQNYSIAYYLCKLSQISHQSQQNHPKPVRFYTTTLIDCYEPPSFSMHIFEAHCLSAVQIAENFF